MNKTIIIAIIAVVALGLGAYAIFGRTSSPATTVASPVPSPVTEFVEPTDDSMTQLEGTPASPDTETAMEASDEVAYDVKLDSFSFSEKTMQVKAGESIKVKLTNTEGFHDFVIDELNVASSKLAEGKSEVITITAPASAKGKTFEYYCSVGNHRQQGMVGKITVL